MAYIGVQPRLGNFQACDAITASATTTFNLLVGGTAIFPQSAQHCLVSLNGVLQAPISSYTISGSTIVFASALTTDDSIDFITILGDTLDLGTPSDSTVTTAKIVDANVTAAKMFSGFANGITVADHWRLTTSFTGDANPIASNVERVDTGGFGGIGSAMTFSSGSFTFPTTGKYLISAQGRFSLSVDSRYLQLSIQTTVDNGSNYVEATNASSAAKDIDTNNLSISSGMCQHLFDVTNVSTHKVRFLINNQAGSSVTTVGSTSLTYTGFTFIRLGDT